MKVAGGIIGKRGAENGIFIAPPGVDAETASPEQLLLHLTSSTSQIFMRGVVSAPFPAIVLHSLSYAPIIFPNILSTSLLDGTFGSVRPFDNSWPPWRNSQIDSSPGYFTVNQTELGDPSTPYDVHFFAFNRPAP